ncbi:hypothetical protein N5I74_28430, partial [Klebsiella pneumoniae]|uniref:hypothetical protein n=1 Tax=Klebsiella pneumoniae TaxID=573 RepID=UPI0022458DD7
GMRYAGGLGWPRLSGKTGKFSAGSMATRAGFRITHWQSRPSFAVYSGWTWRKTAFILPILTITKKSCALIFSSMSFRACTFPS